MFEIEVSRVESRQAEGNRSPFVNKPTELDSEGCGVPDIMVHYSESVDSQTGLSVVYVKVLM